MQRHRELINTNTDKSVDKSLQQEVGAIREYHFNSWQNSTLPTARTVGTTFTICFLVALFSRVILLLVAQGRMNPRALTQFILQSLAIGIIITVPLVYFDAPFPVTDIIITLVFTLILWENVRQIRSIVQKNIYLITIDNTKIYIDLKEGFIVNDSDKIVMKSITAILGRNKKIDFQFTCNDKQFFWRYRYLKVSHISEIYLMGKSRIDQSSSEVGRGTLRTASTDGVKFSCDCKDEIPNGYLKTDSKKLISVKFEEPDYEED